MKNIIAAVICLSLFAGCKKVCGDCGAPPSTNSVKDASGNTYPTVKIGNQVWMKESLRTTKYSDGTDIPVVADPNQWNANINSADLLKRSMMCWYDNDQATFTQNKIGALYTGYAIFPATNGNKKICPTGWHVPSDDEWTALTDFLGGESIAGGKMKSTGTELWQIPNEGATNSSGFSGLPGGYRSTLGEYGYFELRGYWWSSTELEEDNKAAYVRYLQDNDVRVFNTVANKIGTLSVRCVQD